MITEGQRVRITTGPFAGKTGTIVFVYPGGTDASRHCRIVIDGDSAPYRIIAARRLEVILLA